jgi:hypothetical protein
MEVTEKQIKEWKQKHGDIYVLEAEDGKVGYISDPLAKLNVVKQAFAALEKEGMIGMATVYLNNCWLGGDTEIRERESYGNDLADKIDEIAKLPDFTIERLEACYLIKSEGMELKVRTAKRADIIAAEQRNTTQEPFATAEYLLQAIALEKESLETVKITTRAYIGMLRATNKVKDKTYTTVKKL